MMLAWAEGLDQEDLIVTPSGVTGSDITMSPLAKQVFPFDSVECKNTEKLNVWAALEQMQHHGKLPVLAFRRNRSELYVCMKAEDFFAII